MQQKILTDHLTGESNKSTTICSATFGDKNECSATALCATMLSLHVLYRLGQAKTKKIYLKQSTGQQP
jgi:hypothetical protein